MYIYIDYIYIRLYIYIDYDITCVCIYIPLLHIGLQCVAMRCNALQCVAMRCNALQCVAMHFQCLRCFCGAWHCFSLGSCACRVCLYGWWFHLSSSCSPWTHAPKHSIEHSWSTFCLERRLQHTWLVLSCTVMPFAITCHHLPASTEESRHISVQWRASRYLMKFKRIY